MKKSLLKVIVLTISLISIRFINVQAQALPVTRGIYVSNINDILSNSTKTDSLLNYIRAYQFNYITLYSLRNINWNSTYETDRLASFIKKAKLYYGVLQVGASGEKYSTFTSTILPYNNSRSDTMERFNVLNFEFEFWSLSQISASYCNSYLTPNGYTCDTAGAFAYSFGQLQRIDSLCAANGLVSEIYIGWPNTGQLQKIASVADRVLVHAYRTSDIDVYAKSRERLKGLASQNQKVDVMPIFSSEPNFMGTFLTNNTVKKPFDTYQRDMQNDTDSYKSLIQLKGYQWYVYDYMPKILPPDATITLSGSTQICPGGSVTLTASPGSNYLWSNGDTTQSIQVNAAGSYSVTISQAYGAISTSSPITLTIGSAPALTITASGPTSFCAGDSVRLTADSGFAYLWSNGATTRTITVTQGGNYYVVGTNSNGCAAISNSLLVKVNITPAVPTISSNTSLSICQGNSVVLTSSQANGYRWSNGETTRSIIVSAAGNYSVRVYSGPNCYTTSAVKTVNILANPPRPTVTINGSTQLSTANSTVQLISSTANAYKWSNGSSNRSVTIRSQGNYRVTITASNGCKATSSTVSVTANGCIPPPVPTITANRSLYIPAGDSVQLFATSGFPGYRWSTGNTNSSMYAKAGTYTVRVYNGGYCYSESLPVNVVEFATRMSETIEENPFTGFDIFPNPAKNYLQTKIFSNIDQIAVIRITNLTGQIIYSNNISLVKGLNDLTIDLSNFKSGIYLITYENQESVSTKRLIIE